MSSAADELAATEAERRSLEELRAAAAEVDGAMERHCVRCFLIAERLAAMRAKELDREVALCAAFLHDIGLYPSISHGGVYTAEGAEVAYRIGLECGWSEVRASLCSDACAHHHALRNRWPLGAEVETLRLADRVEVSGGLIRSGLSRNSLRQINAAAPRAGFYRGLVKVVWPLIRSRPRTLPGVFRP